MDVDLFNFDLPRDRIALRPASPRTAARLLVIGGEDLQDRQIPDFVSFLQPGDVLVTNDTRVIPARLKGRRGEAAVEVTLHMMVTPTRWKAFAKPARKLRPGDEVLFSTLRATVTEKGEAGEVELRFHVADDEMMAALDQAGVMPLPPYIASQRPVDDRDLEDYQTVFAARDGAVAAPTAGLHFTPELMQQIADKGVVNHRVTLHVGAGTFLPVKATDTEDHKMHAEWGEISAKTASALNDARAHGGRIIAVGTTSLRLLESASTADGIVRPFSGTTDIFITPGYRFRAVDLLLTNFHLPKSTLFMLVSAFSGLETMKSAYAHAVASGYRFYSYGDACLLQGKGDKSD